MLIIDCGIHQPVRQDPLGQSSQAALLKAQPAKHQGTPTTSNLLAFWTHYLRAIHLICHIHALRSQLCPPPTANQSRYPTAGSVRSDIAFNPNRAAHGFVRRDVGAGSLVNPKDPADAPALHPTDPPRKHGPTDRVHFVHPSYHQQSQCLYHATPLLILGRTMQRLPARTHLLNPNFIFLLKDDAPCSSRNNF